MRIRLPKTRRYRVYLYVLSALIILTAIDLLVARLLRHVTLAADTTRITTPLLPDGMPDYLAAINNQLSAGVTPDNNAAVPLITLIGPKLFADSALAETCDQLHIPPPAQPAHPFVLYDLWYEDHHPHATHVPDTEDPTTSVTNHPWQPADHPDAAAWLAESNAAIDAFDELTRRPRYDIPYTSNNPDHLLIEVYLPSLSPIRGLADAARIRAMQRIASHDLDGAWQDLLAAHRMARLLSNGSATLIEQLVATSIESATATADIALAQSPDLTPDQARRCIADLRALPPLSPMARTIDTFERYSLLSYVTTASVRGTPWAMKYMHAIASDDFTLSVSRWYCVFIPIAYNHSLRTSNTFYDRLAAAARAPRYADSVALESSLNDQINALKQRNILTRFTTGDVFSIWLVPALSRAIILERSAFQRTDLAQLAFALAAYHADHHAYPDSLNPLLFAYLPALPKDRFADAPLIYHATANTYLVYSIGPNLQDEAGQDHTTSKKTPPPDDIAISLNPTPASQP